MPTTDILARFHAALGYDLIPNWTAPNQTIADADSVVNDGRSPLVNSRVVEGVHRYSISPDLAANLYAERSGKGMVLGYSKGTQTASDSQRSGTGRARKADLPVEVILVRVIDGHSDLADVHAGMESGTAAYDLDRVEDLVTRSVQERSPDKFGEFTVSLEASRRLGVDGFEGWIGRLLEYNVLRDMRNITAT